MFNRLSVLALVSAFALPLVCLPAALHAQTYVPPSGADSGDVNAAPLNPPSGGSGASYAGGSMPSRDTLQMRVNDLEQQLRTLTDQLERKDFETRQLRTELERLSKDTQNRLTALENAAPAAGAKTPDAPKPFVETPAAPDAGAVKAPTAQQQTPPAADAKMDGAYKPDPNTTPKLGQVVEPKDKGASAASTVKPVTSSLSAAKDYDAAFSAFQAGKYAESEKNFAAFLKTYPAHTLSANAQYWMGEAQFAQNNYQGAARTFARNFQAYPKSEKAPDALLRLSDTLDKMGKGSDACLTLKEMKTRFPKASPAILQRAGETSKRLSCGA